MKAAFKNDLERGRGYARLLLTEITDPSVGNWRFSLCRSTDHTYLGRSDWQNSEDFMEAEAYTFNGDELALHIGPDIVDRLSANENYRIALQGADQNVQHAVMAITDLNQTLMTGAGRVSGDVPKIQPTMTAPPEVPLSPPVAEPVLPDPLPTAMPAPAPEGKSKLPFILAAVLILALAGGGAWWAMTKDAKAPLTAESKKEDTPQPIEPKKEDASQPVEPKKEDTPQPVEPKKETAEPAKPQSVPLSPREQVRQFFSGSPTAQSAMELGSKLPQATAEDQDALYRLWSFAADEGNLQAHLLLAQSVDPAQAAWGSIKKNGAEAWKYYAKVAPTLPEAAKAMQGLKLWMEQQATKGNREALGWIQKIADETK